MNRIGLVWRACLVALCVAWLAPAMAQDLAKEQAARQAQQPLNNAPVWKEVRSEQAHYTSTRGVEAGVLIQSGGQTWRQLREGPITLYGGAVLSAVVVLIGLYYSVKGPLKLHEPPTGRQIERFGTLDRLTHWGLAISFVILGATGLIMLFGKHVLLPVFGYSMFAVLAQLSKNLHNFVGPLFVVFTLLGFFVWAKDNVWQAADADWIAKAGGLVSGQHVPSHRFNFGEKTWFWIGVVGLGLAVGVTGLVLNFPNFEQGRGLMQQMNIIHVIAALVFVCLSLGHIYMGTIGVDGAYESMRYGYVDETWAKEHHELWYDETKHLAHKPEERAAAGSGAVAHSS